MKPTLLDRLQIELDSFEIFLASEDYAKAFHHLEQALALMKALVKESELALALTHKGVDLKTVALSLIHFLSLPPT